MHSTHTSSWNKEMSGVLSWRVLNSPFSRSILSDAIHPRWIDLKERLLAAIPSHINWFDILDYHNSKRGGIVRIDVRVLMNNYLSECNVRPFVCLTYGCCLCLMILCVRRCDVQRTGLLMELESSIHMWLRMRWYSANITITLSLYLLARSTGMFICLFLPSICVLMIRYTIFMGIIQNHTIKIFGCHFRDSNPSPWAWEAEAAVMGWPDGRKLFVLYLERLWFV